MRNRIAESEMILNDRGAIYHLDLRPEELAPVVITVGDPNRVPEVSKHFDRIEFKGSHREFVTHTGYIGNKRISVVSTGIGPDNIDITLNELDALVNIDFSTRMIKENLHSLTIIRMGTCGGLQPEIPTDGLIASSYGLGLDNLMHYYTFKQTQEEDILINSFIEHADLYKKHIIPYFFPGDHDLLQAFVRSGYFHGITATCPGFYAPQGRMLRIPVNFPGLPEKLSSFRYKDFRITNFEMETSAIYGLGKLMGHHCLSINTIIANRTNHQFSKDMKKSVENMITKSLEILLEI